MKANLSKAFHFPRRVSAGFSSTQKGHGCHMYIFHGTSFTLIIYRPPQPFRIGKRHLDGRKLDILTIPRFKFRCPCLERPAVWRCNLHVHVLKCVNVIN